MITGRAKMGNENSAATPMMELTARPPAAWTESMPVLASIRYCTLAPTASPPGSVLVTALPARPAVTTANQLLVRKTRRSSAIAQKKLDASAMNATSSHQGSRVKSLGPADATRTSSGRRM